MLIPAIIIVYFVVIIAVGIFSRKKTREADDYFVAGRKSSSWFVTGSLLATIVGGSAIMVTSRLGYVRGLTGGWWLLVGSAGLLVLGIFLARKVRDYGLYTLPELVEKQYDRRVALAASALVVVAWVGVIAAQIIAAGSIMGVLGLGDPVVWMAVFTGVFVVYTLVGGQHAIIKTDSIQTAVIFAGIFSALVMVMVKTGGFAGLRETLGAGYFTFPVADSFSTYDLVQLLFMVGLTYVVGPDMYSRLFCARDAKTARKATIWAAVLLVPVAIAVTLIGMGAAALYPEISAGDAFPAVINGVLPEFVGGIVLAALLCAFMSSADTTLLTAGTILSVDIVGKINPEIDRNGLLKITRWGIVGLGIISLIVAWRMQNIVSAILFAYTVYTGGLIVPILAGFYRDRTKVTPYGALAAIIGGGGVALVSKIFGIMYLDMISLAVAGILLFSVSAVERKVRSDWKPGIVIEKGAGR